MLNMMRESAGSWIIKVLLGIIVVAFIFMGAGSFSARRTAKVATVNGDPISIADYQQAYYNVLENLRAQFGNRLNDEMIKLLNVKQQALDGLIDTTLVRQAAERNGLRIPDSELAESIIRIPAFQKNGAFDKERYRLLLAQNRLTPESFESMQKEAILMDRLHSLITKTAKISEAEARQWYEWENTSIDFDYVVFKPDTFQDVPVTEDMIAAYYNDHKENFKTNPQVKARYVVFSPDAYKDAAVVTDDEIAAYYAEHPEEFQKPETVSARHVLIQVGEKADAKTVTEAQEKAVEVMKKARAGEDFAELAKTYSDCPSKEKGGDLGAFQREDMVKPFSDAAFAMAVGDISEPVRTSFGWHIIKKEAHTPASTEALEDAKLQITEKLAAQKSRSLAYDAALALYDNTFDGEEFVKNAEDKGLKIITTDFFAQKKGPEGIANPSAFATAAFALPLMEVSDITEIGDAYYLIQTIDRKPEEIPELDVVKEQVTKEVRKAQQSIAAKEAAKAFLEKVRAAGSLAAAAENDAAVTVKTISKLNRNATIPGIGNDGKLKDAAFALTMDHKLPEQVIETETGLYVLELKNRTLPLEQGFAIASANIKDRIRSQKQSALYADWLSSLRKNSEITISTEFMNN